MARLNLLSIAKVELREAAAWYLEQSVSAADRFVTEVESALDSIRQNPAQHPKWDDQYRYCQLRKFPYYIAYRMERDAIVAVAVFHTSRDSAAWANR